MRKIILIALGILLLLFSVYLASNVIEGKPEVRPTVEKPVQAVFIDTVKNMEIPVVIPATGTLVAKNRLELFSEVQGIFVSSAREFRPGQKYLRGEVLLQIDASEYLATVQSARSNLYNLIAALMPDLRLDYQDSYPQWQEYLNNFNINQSTPALPEPKSDQVRYFLTARNIYSSYFNIKNLEQRLQKYRIIAPFTGILTEALVTKGTNIRSGQNLGEFIDPSVFEMEISISKEFVDLMEVGKSVELTNLNKTERYQGTISRINAKVDQATQTVKVFLEVKGDNLREGMYLEAAIDAKKVENAYKIPRKLLLSENRLYIVRDSILDVMEVEPVFFTDKEAVVKGIPDGTKVLINVVPGAFAGQLVKIYQEGTPAGQNE